MTAAIVTVTAGDDLLAATNHVADQGGGVVWLTDTDYDLEGRLITGPNVGLRGNGIGVPTIRLRDDEAYVAIGDYGQSAGKGPWSGGFTIDGMGRAKQGLSIGNGSFRTVQQVRVRRCTDRNIVVNGLQNSDLYTLVSQDCDGDGVVFTAGTKNVNVHGLWASGNDGTGVVLDANLSNYQNPTTVLGNSKVTVYGGLIENNEVSTLRCTAADPVRFVGVHFQHGRDNGNPNMLITKQQHPLLDKTPFSRVELIGCTVRNGTVELVGDVYDWRPVELLLDTATDFDGARLAGDGFAKIFDGRLRTD